MAEPDPNDDGNSADNSQSESDNHQMSISSDEVNYLVFRYLQECGFVHSAFCFAHESMLGSTGLRSVDRTLPPGALVSFLQKGLQYVGIEEKLRTEGKAAEEGKDGKKLTQSNGADFSILSQTVMSALARRDPPLQLIVPPAVAAAAVQARLEAETRIQTETTKEVAKSAKQPPKKKRNKALKSELSSAEEDEKMDDPLQNQQLPLGEVASEVKETAAATPASAGIQRAEELSNSLSENIAMQALTSQQAIHMQRQIASAGAQTQLPEMAPAFVPLQRPNAEIIAVQQGSRPLAAVSDASNLADAAASAIQQQRRQQQQEQEAPPIPSTTSKKSSETAAPSTTTNMQPNSLDNVPKRSNKRQRSFVSEGSQLTSETFPSVSAQAGQVEPLENHRNLAQHGKSITATKDTEPLARMQHQEHLGNHQQTRMAAAQQEFRPIQGGPEFTNGQLIAGSNGVSKLMVQNHLGGTNGDRIEIPQPIVNKLESIDNLGDTGTTQDQILKLQMHESEVFMCAWNPIYTNLIATGSGDASARIWQVGGTKAADGLTTVKLLPHGEDPRDRKNKDVTTLEWSSDGTLLATGSYDGVARVWARSGALIHTLRGHTGPIFSLKWNKQGNFLLSGSYDKTTIVWDVSGSNGFVEQQFTEHQAPALDVDWKDNLTFASCSTDRSVHICRVGVQRPLKVYIGHADEVNAVKWDPSGRLLASCSDDCTAKIWDVESDRTAPLYDLKEHEQEIYTVKWSPTGPGSRNPQKKALLATASFDGSVRLWDVGDGSCYRVFNRHKESVYSVAFSPSGDYLASGSLAGQMYIWDIEQKRHIKSYKGKGDIFEVAWNKEESRVAACFSSNVVAIIDFDKPAS